MVEIGYFLSSEEHSPRDLLHQAQLASDAGIRSVWISDHYHPWLDEQGHSPFVWSVIGAIAATTPLSVTTAVTCPTMRIHPAIIAQAGATSAMLLEGRFELGVGSGENLNEHIFGDAWPITDQRLEMLEEAVEVIRKLWTGEEITHRGRHYTVENARIYSLPPSPPPVIISGFGPKATDLAARIGDGYVQTSPDKELVDRYRTAGGKGHTAAGLKICWGPDEEECAETAHRLWRTSGVPGELSQELRSPALFDQAAGLVTVDKVREQIPCGPDAKPIVEAVQEYVDAGFDRVYVSQIGSNHADFFRFLSRSSFPRSPTSEYDRPSADLGRLGWMTTRPGPLPRFHLAVPVDDLDAARRFYGETLGCAQGRSADTWIDWDLRGHQFVTHLAAGGGRRASNAVDGHDVPVPHFGLILGVDEFHELADRLRAARTRFGIEPYLRFAGLPGEQWTMFLTDPAGNAIEFKAFADDSQVFATG